MEEKDKGLKLEEIITNLKNKDVNLFFFTLDTKGNPTAGIANIYEHVKVLTELGYKAHILHEHNDYKLERDPKDGSMGLVDWLGEEYGKLSHVSIQSQTLGIKPSDFIIIPEIFANVMEQVKGFPCKKIVFSQSPEYLLELLDIGRRWTTDYGFNDVITTSQKQADYVKRLFPTISTHIVPVSIPEYFKASEKPKIPMISIVTRNPGDAAKMAKAFYLQYPHFKWVSFKELRGLPRKDFAAELGNSALAVWIDDMAGFGTFPLEAMECDTPVIGKMPNFIPEWMETADEDGNMTIKNNGVWTNTPHNIPELIAYFIKYWLEDNVPADILNGMESSKGYYTETAQRDKIEAVYGQLVDNRIEEIETIVEQQRLAVEANEAAVAAVAATTDENNETTKED